MSQEAPIFFFNRASSKFYATFAMKYLDINIRIG